MTRVDKKNHTKSRNTPKWQKRNKTRRNKWIVVGGGLTRRQAEAARVHNQELLGLFIENQSFFDNPNYSARFYQLEKDVQEEFIRYRNKILLPQMDPRTVKYVGDVDTLLNQINQKLQRIKIDQLSQQDVSKVNRVRNWVTENAHIRHRIIPVLPKNIDQVIDDLRTYKKVLSSLGKAETSNITEPGPEKESNESEGHLAQGQQADDMENEDDEEDVENEDDEEDVENDDDEEDVENEDDEDEGPTEKIFPETKKRKHEGKVHRKEQTMDQERQTIQMEKARALEQYGRLSKRHSEILEKNKQLEKHTGELDREKTQLITQYLEQLRVETDNLKKECEDELARAKEESKGTYDTEVTKLRQDLLQGYIAELGAKEETLKRDYDTQLTNLQQHHATEIQTGTLQLTALTEKLALAEKKNKDLQKLNTDGIAYVKKLEKENTEFKETHSETIEKNKLDLIQISNELATVRGLLDGASENLRNQQLTITNLETDKEKLTEALTYVIKQLSNLLPGFSENSPITAVSQAVTNLLWEKNTLEEEKARVDSELLNERQELIQLRGLIAGLRQEDTRMQEEIASLQQKITDLEKELDETLDDFNRDQEVIEQLTGERDTANQTVKSQAGTIGQLTRERDTANQTVKSQAGTIGQLTRERDTANTTVGDQQSTITQLNDQNTKLQTTVSTKETEVTSLRNDKATLQSTIRTLEDQILRGTATLTATTTEIENARLNLALHANRILELESERDTANTTVGDQQSTITQLNDQNTKLQTIVSTKETEVTSLRNDKATLQSTIHTLEDQIQRGTATLTTTTTEIENARLNLALYANMILELQRERDSVRGELSEILSSDRPINTYNGKSFTLKDLQNEYDSIKNQLQQCEELKLQMTEQITTLEDQLALKTAELEELENAQANFTKSNARYEAKIVQLLKEKRALATESRHKTYQVDQLQADLRSFADQLATQKELVRMQDAEIESTKEALRTNKIELTNALQAVQVGQLRQTEAEKKIHQSSTGTITLWYKLMKSNRAVSAAAERTRKLELDIQELKDDYKRQTEEREQAVAILNLTQTQTIQRLQEESQKYRMRQQDYTKDIEPLIRDIKAHVHQLTAFQASLSDTISRHETKQQVMEQKINEKEKQVMVLNTKLEEKARKLDESITLYNTQKGRIQTLSQEVADTQSALTKANTTNEEKEKAIQKLIIQLEKNNTEMEAQTEKYTQEIAQLNQTIQTTENEILDAKKTIHENELLIATHKQQLAAMVQTHYLEIKELQETIKRTQDELSDAKSDLVGLTHEKKELEDSVRQKETEVATAQGQVANTENQVRALQEELLELINNKERLEDSVRQKETTENQVRVLEEKLSKLTNEKKELEDSVRQKETEVSTAQSRVAQTLDQLHQLEQQLRNKETKIQTEKVKDERKIDELQQTIQNTQKALTDKEILIEKFQGRLKQRNQENETFSLENHTLKVTIETTEANLSAAQKSLEEKEQLIAKLQTAIRNQESQFLDQSSQTTKIEQLTRDLQSTQRLLLQAGMDLEKYQNIQKEEKEKFDSESKQQQERIEQLTNDLNKGVEEMTKLQQEIETRDNTIQSLQVLLEQNGSALEKAMTDLESMQGTQTTQLTDLEKEREKWNKELRSAQQENADLQKNLEDQRATLQGEWDRMQREREKFQLTEKNLNDQIELMEKNTTKLELQVKEAAKTNQALEDQARNYQIQQKAAAEEMTKKNQLLTIRDQRINELQTNLEKQTTQAKEDARRLGQEISDQTARGDQAQAEVNSLKDRLEKLTEERQEVETELRDLQNTSGNSLRANKEKIDTLVKQIKDSNTELENLKQQIVDKTEEARQARQANEGLMVELEKKQKEIGKNEENQNKAKELKTLIIEAGGAAGKSQNLNSLLTTRMSKNKDTVYNNGAESALNKTSTGEKTTMDDDDDDDDDDDEEGEENELLKKSEQESGKTLSQQFFTMMQQIFTSAKGNPIFTFFFVGILIAGVVMIIVGSKKLDKAKALNRQRCSTNSPSDNTATNIDRQMVTESINEATRLNGSYTILYDNKNVDYRHSYYANLNITTMQSWQPYLTKLHVFLLVVYAISLLIFQRSSSWLSKLKSFLFVAVVTNVYILKFFVSVIIVCYSWIKSNLPKFFFY